jgi:hypothetical protein
MEDLDDAKPARAQVDRGRAGPWVVADSLEVQGGEVSSAQVPGGRGGRVSGRTRG